MKSSIPEFDFKITYEIKPRDLDNIMLIKKELERRGYTVSMQNSFATFPIRAKVIAGLLDDDTYIAAHLSTCRNAHRFINLKPEQIFNNSADKEEDLSLAIRGCAKQSLNIAWGDNSVRRYTEVFGVPKENVYKTGHITMDLLREEFRSYYKTKEELCREFSLDPEKKLYLYISSFVWNALTESVIKGYRASHSGGDPMEKVKMSVESKKGTMEWFDSILPEHPDCEFVYRPHPAEAKSEELAVFASKHKNFHVISNYSVRQWIVASDKIFTWYSTSIGEIYAAKKNCSILRPVEIPHDLDVEIYNNARKITTYEEFEADFDNISSDPADFPISKKDMDYYYYNPTDSYNFERYADAFEKAYKEAAFYIDEPPVPYNLKKGIKFKNFVKDSIASSKIVGFLTKTVMKDSSFEKKVAVYRYKRDERRKNVPTKKELRAAEERIDAILKYRIPRTDK